MESESNIHRFIQTRGHRVSIGTAELGLVREDALAAVSLARQEVHAIIGGDVYLQIAGRIEPAYANWEVNSRHGESLADHGLRSWEESIQYISRYPTPPEGNPLFVLVLAKG